MQTVALQQPQQIRVRVVWILLNREGFDRGLGCLSTQAEVRVDLRAVVLQNALAQTLRVGAADSLVRLGHEDVFRVLRAALF